MPKVEMLKTDGTKEATLELPALFTATPKKEVLHQAVVAYLANQRQANAHTKTRGEVAGGGRKPWRQKGTGRARAGSRRSPIWVGGGITFGPRSDANYSKRLPVKLKRLALSMALSAKAADGKVVVVKDLTITEPKTKQMAAVLDKIVPTTDTALLVTAGIDQKLVRAVKNLPYAAVMPVNELNAYHVLRYHTIVFSEEAVKAIEATFGKAK